MRVPDGGFAGRLKRYGGWVATDRLGAVLAAMAVQELQFELGEGPCVDAWASQEPVLEVKLGVSLDEAFVRLRGRAFTDDRSLREIARRGGVASPAAGALALSRQRCGSAVHNVVQPRAWR